jgi:hypothetical protein
MTKRADLSNSESSTAAAIAPPSDSALSGQHSTLRTPNSPIPNPHSPIPRPAKPFWRLSYREARAIALILAVILWTIAAAFFTATAGYRSLVGPLKGGDLIFFYTLGQAARSGDLARLYDADYLHEMQKSIMPESDTEHYLPVYPPQAFLVYWPLSYLPFKFALIAWTLIVIAVYAWVVHGCWRASRDAIPDGTFVAIAAAAFLPFWSLVLHGHNTWIVLAAFYLAWRAIGREQRFLAGLALGLLMFKPTFGFALAFIVLASGEWAMLAGIVVCSAGQLAMIATLLHASMVTEYVQLMREVSKVEYLIEPKPWELHSIRALTRLVPEWIGMPIWLAASAVVIERTWRIWQRATDDGVRIGVLVLATVLVSPHLFTYDATVLTLTFLLVGAWVERDPIGRTISSQYWGLVCGLYAAFVLPFARIFFVQVSVLLMAGMLFLIARTVLAPAGTSAAGGLPPAGGSVTEFG